MAHPNSLANLNRGPGPGRPKGVTSYLRAKYGDDACKLLAELHKYAFSKSNKVPAKVRIDCIKELLNRGWGTSVQRLGGEDEGAPIQTVVRFGGRLKADGSITGT
jgi:hypothetical protein